MAGFSDKSIVSPFSGNHRRSGLFHSFGDLFDLAVKHPLASNRQLDWDLALTSMTEEKIR